MNVDLRGLKEYLSRKTRNNGESTTNDATSPRQSEESPGRQDPQFYERVQEAPLKQFNARLKVSRPLSKEYEYMIAPLSMMLEEGKDGTAAHHYSFNKFKQIFERQINGTLEVLNSDSHSNPMAGEDMDYGKLGWWSASGDYMRIYDHDHFAAALNSLYMMRTNSEYLTIEYQMEFEEPRRFRIETDQIVDQVEIRWNKRFQSVATPPRRLMEVDVEAGRPMSRGSSQISPRTVLPRRRRISSFVEISPGLPPRQRRGSSLDTTTVGKAREAAKGILNGVSKIGFKGPETKAAERERFKAMLEEKERKSYKRGGNDKEITPEEFRRISETDREVVDGEADDLEQPEDEDNDDDVEIADRIVAKLQELTKLEELTQLDAPGDGIGKSTRWEECCAMFRCDPEKTGMEQRMQIAGLKTPVYQYQALGVYWQMITSREIGGGFLADDMGLGKTLSFLAYIVVERQLAVLHRNVAKSRQAKDGNHLRPGQDGECPTPPTEGWIICPCSASSPTSKLPLQPGLRMACVPAAVVKQWWDQWKLHVDTDDLSLGMKIAIDHPPVFKDITLTSAEMLSSAAAAQTKNRMEAKKAEKGAKADDEPKENNDCILLVTTQEDFPKLAKEFSKIDGGFIRDPKNRKNWIKVPRQNRCSLIFGIAMIDECHEEYFKNSGRAKILTDLPRFNNSVRPYVWGYSGTPFSQTPRGIEGVLWAIEKHSKSVNEAYSWRKLDGICKKFDEQLKSGKLDNNAVDTCLGDFKSFLSRYMIRRTADTLWFGHPLVDMKPHIHTDVTLVSDGTFAEEIRDYEQQFDAERETMLTALQVKWDQSAPGLRRSNIRPVRLGFNVMIRAYWRSRLLATFPYLQRLTSLELEKPLDLSQEEVQEFIKAPARDSNPYKKNIKAIVENSQKCLWLYDFILDLQGRRDIEGNEHKLVIMTAFPQAAYILSLFIEKYFPEYKDLVGLIPGPMRPSEKVKIINAFTRNAEGNNNKNKHRREVRILIGLTRVIGVGLQLQKACHVVVMEPDYEFVHELQAYGRVHRIGQQNPISRSYRLIDDGSEIESRILQRQVDRKEAAGTRINEEEVRQTEGVLLGGY